MFLLLYLRQPINNEGTEIMNGYYLHTGTSMWTITLRG